MNFILLHRILQLIDLLVKVVQLHQQILSFILIFCVITGQGRHSIGDVIKHILLWPLRTLANTIVGGVLALPWRRHTTLVVQRLHLLPVELLYPEILLMVSVERLLQ